MSLNQQSGSNDSNIHSQKASKNESVTATTTSRHSKDMSRSSSSSSSSTTTPMKMTINTAAVNSTTDTFHTSEPPQHNEHLLVDQLLEKNHNLIDSDRQQQEKDSGDRRDPLTTPSSTTSSSSSTTSKKKNRKKNLTILTPNQEHATHSFPKNIPKSSSADNFNSIQLKDSKSPHKTPSHKRTSSHSTETTPQNPSHTSDTNAETTTTTTQSTTLLDSPPPPIESTTPTASKKTHSNRASSSIQLVRSTSHDEYSIDADSPKPSFHRTRGAYSATRPSRNVSFSPAINEKPHNNGLSHSLDSGGFFTEMPPLQQSNSPKTATLGRQYNQFSSWDEFQADIDQYHKQNKRVSSTAIDLFNVSQQRKHQLLKRRASVAAFSSLSPGYELFGTTSQPQNLLDDWCNNKLNIMKRQTDQDLKLFLFELSQVKNFTSGEVLQNICKQIMATDVQDLKKGKHQDILKQLRELNTNAKSPLMKKYVRKLMFIFSRCTRLLLYIRRQKDTSAASMTASHDHTSGGGGNDSDASLTAAAAARRRKGRSVTMYSHPSSSESLDSLGSEAVLTPRKDSSSRHKRVISDDGINRVDTIDDLHQESITRTPSNDKIPSDNDSHVEKLNTSTSISSISEGVTTPASKRTPNELSSPTAANENDNLQTPGTTEKSDKKKVSPPLVSPIHLNKEDSPVPSNGKQWWNKLVSTFKSFKLKNRDVSPKASPRRSTSREETSSESSSSLSRVNSESDASALPDVTPIKSTPAPQPTKASRKPQVEILCRICEELINASDLAEHSRTCSMRHDLENRLVTADERLKRLSKSIKKRISMSENSRARSLSEKELRMLQTLERLAISVAQLTYTTRSIASCEALLKEAINIREESPRITVQDHNFNKRKAKTVQVYSKRIAEVIQQKLDDMQKRLELPGTMDQSELSITKHKTTIKDFDIIKPISRGAFGTVFLARKKKSKDLFAIKVLKKEQLIRRKQTKRVLAERNIMAMASNEFIVNFYYSFQGRNNLYIVMEYCRGGDVFSLLQKHLQENQAFSVEMAKQFICETILALKYLHSHGIVHRDLKPDNLLICHDGHIKLTDFGLSDLGLIDLDPFYAEAVMGSPLLSPHTDRKKIRDSSDKEADRFRGTPDYLAPEILLGEDHSFPVDWWAVGILLFEFLYGCPPFNADCPSEIFDNILSLSIPWPSREIDDTPREAIDLIEKLLVLDPKKRLGSSGSDEVMQHPFFRDVDWKHLRQRRPHFVPTLLNDEDIGCFSPRQRIFPVSNSLLDDDGVSPPRFTESYSPSVNNSGSFEDMMSPLSSSIEFSFVKTDALAELTLMDREQKMYYQPDTPGVDPDTDAFEASSVDNMESNRYTISGSGEFEDL